MSKFKEIGIVKEIWRYPVKSMAGGALDETKVGWQGLIGDRRYAFNRRHSRSGLPFLSARKLHGLICYHAKYVQPDDVDHSSVVVTGPDNREHDLYSDGLREELEASCGEPLEIISLWRGAFDAMAISMITTASLNSIGQLVGAQLDPQRFRPNLIIESLDGRAYPEDRWVGELVVVGTDNDAARIRVNRKDIRCSIVDLNPATGERDQNVLAEVVKNRKNFAGVYASPERPGKIKIGDVVRIPT